MPRALSPIPPGTAITDSQGLITIFFRLAWQILVDGFQSTPTVAATGAEATGLTAAVVTTTLFNVLSAGMYRVSYTLAKTVADGVSSSLTVTIGWTDNGVAKTHVFAALTTDTVTAVDAGSWTLHADANSLITYAIAYASNTPATMKYDAHLTAELMA